MYIHIRIHIYIYVYINIYICIDKQIYANNMCARKTFQAKCQAILHPIPLAPGTKSCPAHPCLPPKHSQFALDVSKLQEPQQVQPPGHVSTHHLMYPVSMHCVSGCIRHIYRPIGPSIDQPTLSMYLSIGRSIDLYIYIYCTCMIHHVFACIFFVCMCAYGK
jgi:hypothetical protein